MVRKYLLLGCLRSKPKVVQPFPLAKRMFGSTRFGDGNALANARRPPPPFHPQYHQMMMMMNPQFQMNGAPPMHMIQQQSGPPQNTPYHLTLDPNFKAMFPQIQPPKPDPKMLVNSGLHYSGKWLQPLWVISPPRLLLDCVLLKTLFIILSKRILFFLVDLWVPFADCRHWTFAKRLRPNLLKKWIEYNLFLIKFCMCLIASRLLLSQGLEISLLWYFHISPPKSFKHPTNIRRNPELEE